MRKEKTTKPVAVLGGVRLPFARAGGKYADVATGDLLNASLRELVKKFKLEGKTLGEVCLGTVFFPPALWNMSREAVFNSGLSPATPASGIQRACATSLDAAIMVGNKISLGNIEVGVAGGAESLSNVALFLQDQFARRIKQTMQAKSLKDRVMAWKGIKLTELKPGSPAAVEVTTRKSMGQHCELMAQEWKIPRDEQDALSYQSHQNTAKAYREGFYKDLVVPFHGLEKDNNFREDTSLEKLAKLKPVFDRGPAGTLTAGNSSPLTDGGATVLLSSDEWAKANNIKVQAYLTEYETAAIDLKNEGLLMAPAYAVPRMLARAGLKLQDFDFYEIHEAFAAQVLCTLKAWESETFCREKLGLKEPLGKIDRAKLNVVGGSVAVGHPFGATGARLIASLAKLLEQKGSGRGLISVCTGGGMGTVAILER